MREFRQVASSSGLEMRSGDEGMPTLVSMAPPWETLSEILGPKDGFRFREKFARGAFGDLSAADVISTVEHDGRLLLGRTPATLRLEDTEAGLRYEVDLPETSPARDLAVSVARGDMRGSSFEFTVTRDRWDDAEGDGLPVRTVLEAELFQVGPVTSPAYRNGTDVALRSYAAARDVERAWELELDLLERELALVRAGF